MLTRRGFLALASGILVPVPEPVKAYSFVGGWAEPSPLHRGIVGRTVKLARSSCPGDCIVLHHDGRHALTVLGPLDELLFAAGQSSQRMVVEFMRTDDGLSHKLISLYRSPVEEAHT